jgi:uncharacterized protein YraI
MVRKLSLLILAIVALGAFAFVPAAAQIGLTWNMQIYPNGILAGNPIVTQQVGQVAFDWGAGTPANGVGADNFSIRFASDPYFTAGTYRFYAWADDEVNVNVGYAFQPQIDTFNKNQVGQVVYADVPLTEGVHHVQVNYREGAGNAYVYVTWANLATNPTGPNFPAPQNSFSNLNNGGTWWAQYFNNRDLSGTPALQQSEPSVNHDWGTGAPGAGVNADNFSVRWNAYLTLDAGLYQISVNADDGVRVTVDGQRVIDQWHDAANTTYNTAVNLAAGSHTFVVEYYEAAGAAFIHYTLSLGGVAVGTGQQPGNGQQQQPNTGVIATVTTGRLNVRSAAGLGNRVVAKINRGETYAVLGSSADKSWYQISVNGTVGWVSAQFVTVSQGSVPVAGNTPTVNQPAVTGQPALVLATLNLRDTPNARGASLAKIQFNTTVQVIGRNAAGTWWQVRYQNLTGWVSSRYARLQQGTIRDLPVTG